MAAQIDLDEVLRQVASWPAERRAWLAHALVESLERDARDSATKPKLKKIIGVARGAGAPPTDEAVRQIINQERMRKYG
jgi:hypothetical protein